MGEESSTTDTEAPLDYETFEYLKIANNSSWSDCSIVDLNSLENENLAVTTPRYFQRQESLDQLLSKVNYAAQDVPPELLTAIDPYPPPEFRHTPYPEEELTGPIPCNQDWPGPLDFSVTFPSNDNNPLPKSLSWTYSEELKKLFVDLNKSFPILVHLSRWPPDGLVLRALPVYSSVNHIITPVRRCPVHCNKEDPTNHHFRHVKHVVRFNHHRAYYQEQSSERYSVATPLVAPPAGVNYHTILTLFGCLSSCMGGINRRALQLVLTVEYNGRVVGRQAVEVRVCACPGRDCRIEEKKLHDRDKPREVPVSEASMSVRRLLPSEAEHEPSSKRTKIDPSSFIIKVQNKAIYEFLMDQKNRLEEMMNEIPNVPAWPASNMKREF